MRISRIGITNFTNFQALDIWTGDNIVVVGENKVGKSNFIRALQLVLDPGLSERDRGGARGRRTWISGVRRGHLGLGLAEDG